MTQMIPVPHSHPIDVGQWNFLTDPINECIAAAVREALTETFSNEPPELTLPAVWGDQDGDGGPPPENPLTIYVSIPLAVSDDGVLFRTTVDEMVDEYLTYYQDDGSFEDGLIRIRDGLKALADRLDAILTEPREDRPS